MFKRKMKAAFYATLLLAMFFGAFYIVLIPILIFKSEFSVFGAFGMLGIVPFVFTYALIGNVLYGLPTSVFAEYVTKNIKKGQLLYSFVLHISFGLTTIFFLKELAIYSIISAILFFLVDTRLKNNQNHLFQKPTFIK